MPLVKYVYVAIILALVYSVKTQSNPCAGVWNGNVPNPEICYKYYSCFLSIATEKVCDPNTVYNILTYSCVPGNQNTCEIYSAETTTYPTVENTTSVYVESSTTTYTSYVNETTTQAPPEVDLDAICEGVFFAARPYPNSDLLYVGCQRGRGLIYQCLDKEYFDEDINECVRICEVPEDVCVGTTQVQVIENPCNCVSFIVCYNQRIVLTQACIEGEIFNIEQGA